MTLEWLTCPCRYQFLSWKINSTLSEVLKWALVSSRMFCKDSWSQNWRKSQAQSIKYSFTKKKYYLPQNWFWDSETLLNATMSKITFYSMISLIVRLNFRPYQDTQSLQIPQEKLQACFSPSRWYKRWEFVHETTK